MNFIDNNCYTLNFFKKAPVHMHTGSEKKSLQNAH